MGNKIDRAINAVKQTNLFEDIFARKTPYVYEEDNEERRKKAWKQSRQAMRRLNLLLNSMVAKSPRFQEYVREVVVSPAYRLVDGSAGIAFFTSKQLSDLEMVHLCLDVAPYRFYLRYQYWVGGIAIVDVNFNNHDPRKYPFLWDKILNLNSASQVIAFLALMTKKVPK